MTGDDLKFLADTTGISKSDYTASGFGISRLSLARRGPELVAFYRGAYSQGRRWISTDSTTPDLNITVDADHFAKLAPAFAEQTDVQIAHTGDSISLGAKGRGVKLKVLAKMEPDTLNTERPPTTMRCRVPVDALLPEVELAGNFIAKSMARPILTGVNLILDATRQRIGIMAYDGFTTLFTTSIPAEVETSTKVPIPSHDLVLGLRLCRSGTVELQLDERRLYLYGDKADFSVAQLQGTFPDYTSLIRRTGFAHEFTVDTKQVRSAVSAANALQAAKELEVVLQNDVLTLRTRFSSKGQFGTKSDHKVETEGKFTYDSSMLQRAALMGDALTVHIPEADDGVTWIEAKARSMWVKQRLHFATGSGEVIKGPIETS